MYKTKRARRAHSHKMDLTMLENMRSSKESPCQHLNTIVTRTTSCITKTYPIMASKSVQRHIQSGHIKSLTLESVTEMFRANLTNDKSASAALYRRIKFLD